MREQLISPPLGSRNSTSSMRLAREFGDQRRLYSVSARPTRSTAAATFPTTYAAATHRETALCNSSASQPTIKIKAISNAKSGVVTTNGPHGLQNGDIVRLYFCGYSGYGGMYELNNLTVKVQNITTDTFAMQQFTTAWTDLDTTTFHAYADGIKAGEVYKTISTNRAGTFVYGLNYSSFNKPGTFYLRISGLGIPTQYVLTTKSGTMPHGSAKGDYHHRWGTALDGRFGFTRPTNCDVVARQFTKAIYRIWSPILVVRWRMSWKSVQEPPHLGYAVPP